ncbi:hypothetical protein N7462_008409 [Penicillium macrosclerotiorum]|uniref:uncharacterized protein n=1 Tax=Penicillium macrosclerotiorum TaxID=303699 RepID=UPI002546B362|nr:uncharacterized protein N7462_008409 [Penicillium macrosclerotiorum]KAJ5675512.1 hypothetical protein N7462_008409 [Penicillium macrosclerotiorum]
MGSAASKPVKSAAGAAARRQYPKQAPPPPRVPPTAPKATEPSQTPTPHTPPPSSSSHAPKPVPKGPTYHSNEQPSTIKSSAIDLDGRDPDFAASLRHIGPVDPFPTLSNSSTVNRGSMQTIFPTASNPALLVVNARQRINKAAQEELEQLGSGEFAGRQFLDAFSIQQALTMRDRQGMPRREIERLMRLKSGVMDRLGKDGLVSRAG